MPARKRRRVEFATRSSNFGAASGSSSSSLPTVPETSALASAASASSSSSLPPPSSASSSSSSSSSSCSVSTSFSSSSSSSVAVGISGKPRPILRRRASSEQLEAVAYVRSGAFAAAAGSGASIASNGSTGGKSGDEEGVSESRARARSASGSGSSEMGGMVIPSPSAKRSGANASIMLSDYANLLEENDRMKSELRMLRGGKVEMATVVHTLDHDNVRGLYTRRRALSRQASQATRAALGRMQAKATDEVADHLINVVRANVNLNDVASERFAELFIGLCKRVAPLLEADDRVVELRSPVHVFGDLHGNLDDLRFFCNSVWPLGMKLTAGKFLFLGDFVDRGEYSVEVLTYLFAQKLRCPNKVFLVRGNHEMRAVNGWEELYKKGSFLTQCKKRYGKEMGEVVWEAANECFDRLPLAAVVDNSVFCVHGGIPRPHPDGKTKRLDMIRSIPSKLSFEDDYEKEEAQEMMDEDEGEVEEEDEKEEEASAAEGGNDDEDGYVSPTPETERKLTEIAKTLESKEKAALEVAAQERQQAVGEHKSARGGEDEEGGRKKGEDGGTTLAGDAMASALLLAQRRLAFNLMWSDPAYARQEPDLDGDGFGPGVRGEDSLVYGNRAIAEFLKENGLDCIIRAHEAQAAGVSISKSAKVVTVFSTSKDHGCGSGAMCGFVLIDDHKLRIINRAPRIAKGALTTEQLQARHRQFQ